MAIKIKLWIKPPDSSKPNIYMYEQVRGLLKPRANSPNPFGELLNDF